jgi:transposase
MDPTLFDMGPPDDASASPPKSIGGRLRLRVPQRDQVEMRYLSLDELLDPNHPARSIWTMVYGLDLSRWLEKVRAVEGNVGRDATDPRMLMALWVYGTIEAVGSARELARLTEVDLPYQWICGGVSVNYHMLSDFRSQNGEAWDELLTQIVASLSAQGLVSMKRVAQDGMRVRADAGKSSFHRKATLEECLKAAREQVDALKRLVDETPNELSKQQQAAQKRAAEEMAARVEEALKNCEELQQQREETSKKSCKPAKEARASTTDPEARNMKFADGGYRPGYNVQYVTDVDSGVIVDAAVVNAGNDFDQAPPRLDALQNRYGVSPEELLVDGGFASKDTIEQTTARGIVIYAPLKEEEKQRAAGKDPYARKRLDSPAMADWRARMATDEARRTYRLRGQTAEWVNAQARNRGFWRTPVRGLKKTGIIARLYAITHNIVTAIRLRAAAVAA